jgi:hypothetical protein
LRGDDEKRYVSYDNFCNEVLAAAVINRSVHADEFAFMNWNNVAQIRDGIPQYLTISRRRLT